MQSTFSLTAFFRGLFSTSRPSIDSEASPATGRSVRQVPPQDTGARSGSAFYCCCGVRPQAQAYGGDSLPDGGSRALLFMPDLDEGIQIRGGLLQPGGAEPVSWQERDVRLAQASPPEPLSRGRTAPSEQTLLTAKGLADQVRDILNSAGSERVKRESLAALLQRVSKDPELVECLVLNVLTSPQLNEAQKVYFIAHLARHHVDDGRTQPPKPLSRDAVLAITQSLRDERARWRDKTSYGQAFSHFYEGARFILEEGDLRREKAALQDRDFVASLRNHAGNFNLWAITKLDELLRLQPH